MTDIESIIGSLEQQRSAIERALEALRDVSGASVPAAKKRGRPPGKKASASGKRVLSQEGRASIIAAAKKRWALAKKEGKQKPAAKKRGGLTVAGRKRLSEAMKARWASKNSPRKVAAKR